MTREEARQIIIDWLTKSKGEKNQCGYIEGWFYERDVEAFRMAIKALEQERPEIIRCKNCRHDKNCEIQYSAQAGSKFFCGLAEGREE